MRLLVDIGNSRVKWRLADGGFRGGGLFPIPPGADPTPIFDAAWGTLEPPSLIAVSNVAGRESGERLQRWCGDRWGIPPSFARATPSCCGVINGYRDPSRLGVDRWIALIGARALESGSVLVVDCGTALTVDLLDGEGCHRGGMILPGLRLMAEALRRGTRIPPIEDPDFQTAPLLGASTEECIAAGGVAAAAGAVEWALHRVTSGGEGPISLITGGDAGLLLPLLTGNRRHEPDLIFHGLARWADEANG